MTDSVKPNPLRHPEQAAQRPCRRTQWPRLLRLALQMGIAPEGFWRLSLAEWRALTSTQNEALTRAAFEDLARRFPDKDA